MIGRAPRIDGTVLSEMSSIDTIYEKPMFKMKAFGHTLTIWPARIVPGMRK